MNRIREITPERRAMWGVVRAALATMRHARTLHKALCDPTVPGDLVDREHRIIAKAYGVAVLALHSAGYAVSARLWSQRAALLIRINALAVHAASTRDMHLCQCIGTDDPYTEVVRIAKALEWPTAYREDLTVHTYRECREHSNSTPFYLLLRPYGCDTVYPRSMPGWQRCADPGQSGLDAWVNSVVYNFGDGDPRARLRFYRWDGSTMVPHRIQATYTLIASPLVMPGGDNSGD